MGLGARRAAAVSVASADLARKPRPCCGYPSVPQAHRQRPASHRHQRPSNLPPRVCISRCGSRRSRLTGMNGARSRSAARSSAPRSSRRLQTVAITSAITSSDAPDRSKARRSVPSRAYRQRNQRPSAVSRLRSHVAAEGRGGRRDDPECRAVREREPIGRGPRSVEDRVSPLRSDASTACSMSVREKTRSGDHCVAPPTSMYSMNRTSAPIARRVLEQRHDLVVVRASHDRRNRS